MFPAVLLLHTVLCLVVLIVASPAVARSPHTALSFAKRINTNGSGRNLVQQDQAHVAALNERIAAIQSRKQNRRESGSIGITAYEPSTDYIASVGIGSPPVTYNLLVDLTSANTWIGADKTYTPTATSKDTGQPGGVWAGAQFFSGEEWLDTVDLGSGLVVAKQTIGVASESHGYAPGVDGVLGLAPTYLTVGTLFNQPQVVLPTILDNLYDQAIIPNKVFSLSFMPRSSGNSTRGELTFGGTDSNKYTGEIRYVPVTSAHPSELFWGIDQSITYGDKTILAQTAGIVSARVSLILLACDAYYAYKNATRATEDPTTDMLKLTTSQYDKLQNLDFNIGSGTYVLSPNGQIWPRALNSYVGGSNNAVYSIIGNRGPPSGLGLDFVLGQVFLERFYTVFDAMNGRVGFATTSDTDAMIN